MQSRSLLWGCLISCFVVCLTAAEPAQLIPRVIAKLVHALPAYTQGLSIEDDELYESTGLYGQSTVRALDILNGRVKKRQNLSSQFFGEGLATFPKYVYQLTWKEQEAFVYDRFTFQLLKTHPYRGEGWGLCRDGDTLWMSDGSSTLYQRDAKTFNILRTLEAHLDGKKMSRLNDLTCDGQFLYANVYNSYIIVRIDKNSGEVKGIINGVDLLSAVEKQKLKPDEVMNGIAFWPKKETFLLTGKNWPWIFEVKLDACTTGFKGYN